MGEAPSLKRQAGSIAPNDLPKIGISSSKKTKRLQAEACNRLILLVFFGVADGARTHDNRNHNAELVD